MKLKELVKTFGLSASQVEDLDVYPEHAIRNIEFDRKTPRWDKGPDYRERTITRLIHHRASFNSEWNIFGDIAKMVLAFKCPVCKVDIGVKYTGGAGNTMCIEGTCKSCNVKVSMGIPSDCIRVHFEEPVVTKPPACKS